MSLIDEALKRARDEAARQEEALRREKRPWVPPPPKKPRRRPGIAALAGVAAIGMLAGAGWLALRRSAGPSTAAGRPATPAPAVPAARPAPPSPPPVLETVEVPPPAGAEKPRPEATVPGPSAPASGRGAALPGTSPAAAAPPAPSGRAPEAAPEAAPPPHAAPPARPPAAAPAAAPLRDGKSFVRVAPLPSGEKIELEGIVYSDTNPVAVIGGKVLGPGAYVDDYQIVRIEENRVTLKGRGITFFVTLS